MGIEGWFRLKGYWYLVGFAMGMSALASGDSRSFLRYQKRISLTDTQAECRHAALDAAQTSVEHVLERKNLHFQYRGLCRRVEKGFGGE